VSLGRLYGRELAVAHDAAIHAGRALMRHYGEATPQPGDGKAVTDAERVSNELIVASLRAEFPEDAVLSEAAEGAADRHDRSRIWIVDPLDGTKEFMAGLGEFSVMIALLVDNALKVGVIYKPVDNVLYWATAGGGAFKLNGSGPERLTCGTAQKGVRVISSRSHDSPIVRELCKRHNFTDVEPCGSVGLKCTRIAEGLRDLYIQPAASMGEWDTAAPELILAEAGASVTDCRGHALTYNKRDPRQPHGILAAHPGLAFRVLPTIAELMRA
jgi:3'(2'), 5'-bisphosphate nucleotidase